MSKADKAVSRKDARKIARKAARKQARKRCLGEEDVKRIIRDMLAPGDGINLYPADGKNTVALCQNSD